MTKRKSFRDELFELRRYNTDGKQDFRLKNKSLDELVELARKKFT